MFKGLYHWTLSLAESPRAPWALAGVSFAESSFFPVPPDVILVPWIYKDVALIANQARELGIKAKLLGGDGWKTAG